LSPEVDDVQWALPRPVPDLGLDHKAADNDLHQAGRPEEITGSAMHKLVSGKQTADGTVPPSEHIERTVAKTGEKPNKISA